MRRSVEDALLAFRGQVKAWAAGEAAADIRVLVYPPEHEPLMLVRLPQVADDLTQEGHAVDVVDVGEAFRQDLESMPQRLDRMRELERTGTDKLLRTLGQLAERTVMRLLAQPLPDGTVCRLVINTGSLGVFVSYSAITNQLQGSTETQTPPTVIAFPGEGDDRSLDLLGLRADTNYRVARV